MFTVDFDDGSLYNYNLSKTVITKSCVLEKHSKWNVAKT